MGRTNARRVHSPPHAPPAHSQRLSKWGYMSLGLWAALPCVLLPPLLQNKADAARPFAQVGLRDARSSVV